jgi:hypothetical protein
MKLNWSVIQNRYILFACIAVLFFVNVPYLFLGQDFYVGFGYDNLDSNVIFAKLIKDNNAYFAPSSKIIEQPLSGLPRAVFDSEISVSSLLNYLLEIPQAYVVNLLLLQIIAFAGMILFLRKRYDDGSLLVIYGTALIFSQLNFWPHAGISLAGLPLLFYAYLMFPQKKALAVGVLLLYALYSNMILTGIFLIGLWCLWVVYKIAKKERFKNDLIFIGTLTLLYVLSEYRLILSVLDQHFSSIRTEFVKPAFNISEALNVFLKIIFSEYGHNVKHPLLIIIATASLLLVIKKENIVWREQIVKIIFFILFVAFITVLFQSKFVYGITSQVPILRTVQLQRFYWLLPPVFYLLMFLVYDSFWKNKKYPIVILLLFFQFIVVVQDNINWRTIVKTKIFNKEAGALTFHQFYSPELYREISNFIGKEKHTYRVASLGLQPAAALYSGFYTIDGYLTNYPLEYKHKFNAIIEKELAKNTIARDFFKNWGGVVVILSAEIIGRYQGRGFLIPAFSKKEKDLIIKDLDINTDVLNELNCKYIFSSFKIENADRTGLKFIKYFERADSPWGINLYLVN